MKTESPHKKAVVYARYSSDLQSDRSVEDQFALCRAFAARQGYVVTEVFSDRARSGASLFGRDGLLALLERAKARAFDFVIVEAVDRLSRDQEDLAAIFKRLRFVGVDIVAVHDGVADAVQIGIRGLVGSLYLTDLANKVRRGLTGRVREGLSAGGRAFGYRPIPGKPGELEIEQGEAAAVLRIFTEFVSGRSPRDIAYGLNRDRVPSPRGEVWNASTINGSRSRSNGILRNSIYNGELVWNRVRMVRDPDTGKRISRMNPESEWQRVEVPHLRIVSPEIWEAAVARIEGRKARIGYTPRRPRMLSGLLRCATCGSGMTLDGQTNGHVRIRCSRARESGSCDHTRKYPLAVIERAVVDGLREQLGNPEALALYIDTYIEERRRLAIDAVNNRGRIETTLAKKRAEVERLLDVYMKGLITVEQFGERRPPLDAEIAKLEADLAVAPPIKAVELHPTALATYRQDLDVLSRRLREAQEDPRAPILEPLRRLVGAVIVHPSPPREAIEIEIKGKLSSLLGEPVELPPQGRRLGIEVVAGERVNPYPHIELATIAHFSVGLRSGYAIRHAA